MVLGHKSLIIRELVAKKTAQLPLKSLVTPKEHSKAPAQKPSFSSSLSKDDRKALYSGTDGIRVPSLVSSVDSSPALHQLGDYVMFYDKHNEKHYGLVRWTGREHRDKKFPFWVVGIQTVS